MMVVTTLVGVAIVPPAMTIPVVPGPRHVPRNVPVLVPNLRNVRGSRLGLRRNSQRRKRNRNDRPRNHRPRPVPSAHPDHLPTRLPCKQSRAETTEGHRPRPDFRVRIPRRDETPSGTTLTRRPELPPQACPDRYANCGSEPAESERSCWRTTPEQPEASPRSAPRQLPE